MGSMRTAGMIEAMQDGLVELGSVLTDHLTANHYPPLPVQLVAAAEEAIKKASDGEWEADITMPEGLTFRGQDAATVRQIVTSMHLEQFVDSEVF